MLWSSAKVESRELTGEPDNSTIHYSHPVKPLKLGSEIPSSAYSYGPRYWSWRKDLNPRPADYKSAALPAELRQHWQSF